MAKVVMVAADEQMQILLLINGACSNQRFAGEGLLVSHYYTKEICQYFQQLLLAKFCG
jgi:hypothetical protein